MPSIIIIISFNFIFLPFQIYHLVNLFIIYTKCYGKCMHETKLIRVKSQFNWEKIVRTESQLWTIYLKCWPLFTAFLGRRLFVYAQNPGLIPLTCFFSSSSLHTFLFFLANMYYALFP